MDSPSLPCIALFLGQSLQTLGHGVSSLSITRAHVIVATSVGELQWFDREEQECVHLVGLPCKDIISLDIDPSYKCFAVTASDGGLFLVEMEDADPLYPPARTSSLCSTPRRSKRSSRSLAGAL